MSEIVFEGKQDEVLRLANDGICADCENDLAECYNLGYCKWQKEEESDA